MMDSIRNYLRLTAVTKDEASCYEKAAERLLSDDGFLKAFQAYEAGESSLPDLILHARKTVAGEAHNDIAALSQRLKDADFVHPHTAEGVVVLLLFPKMHEKYREEGLSDELFINTIADFRYKTRECESTFGLPGVFVGFWYEKIAGLKVFKLGRFEFEPAFFKGKPRMIGGKEINTGDPVIKVHIPTCDEPFNEASWLDAYKKARAFFLSRGIDTEFFTCDSWLLYPALTEMLGPESAIVRFAGCYRIMAEKIYAPEVGMHAVAWRIFGADCIKPVEDYPEDTRLQRGYKARLLRGEGYGAGNGIFRLDGEKCRKD